MLSMIGSQGLVLHLGVSHSQRRAGGRRATWTLEAVFLILKMATMYDSPEIPLPKYHHHALGSSIIPFAMLDHISPAQVGRSQES